MADNIAVTAGTGTNIASDEVTYSGDTAKLGIVRLVHVDGSEGAKTVKELVRLEDAAHTSGDPGIPTLTVRQDTAAALAGTDADYQPLITDGSGRLHVNVGTSALPSGAATSAKQDTIIGHLDGVEGLLTTIDGDTGNISTKIDTIAGAVSGTEMQVDVLTMPTVTVTATNLDVQSGGADLATSTQAGAIQTAVETLDNIVRAEDEASGNGHSGAVVLARRTDTPANQSGTDGDYEFLQMSAGRLWTSSTVTGTVTVDGSGVTQPVSNAGLTELAAAINSNKVDVNIVSSDVATGGTSAADDADFTAGTTPGTPAMGVYDSTPDTVTDGDLGTIGINANRAVRTVIEAGNANIGDVDIASIAAGDNNIGNVDLASAIPAGNNNIGDVDVLSVPVDPFGANADAAATAGSTGSIQAKLRLMTSQLDSIKTAVETIDNTVGGSELQVDVITMPTVTVTATNLDVQSGGADLATSTQAGAIQTAVELIDDTVKVLGTDTYTEATSKGIVMGAVRRDADTTLANTTNEFTPLQVDANGYLKVEIFDGGGSHTVDNAGTFAVQVDGSALTALQLIDDTIFADDAAVTLGTSKGSVLAGVAVQTDGTDPTAVSAEGDAAALRTDMQRNLIVNQTHPRFWHVSADYASAQTNTSVKAAPGASLSLYITDIVVSNGATAGNITLLDGSGGTVLFEIYPAINGGATMSLRSPIKLTANTALCITSTTVTTHSIFVSGYIAP